MRQLRLPILSVSFLMTLALCVIAWAQTSTSVSVVINSQQSTDSPEDLGVIKQGDPIAPVLMTAVPTPGVSSAAVWKWTASGATVMSTGTTGSGSTATGQVATSSPGELSPSFTCSVTDSATSPTSAASGSGTYRAKLVVVAVAELSLKPGVRVSGGRTLSRSDLEITTNPPSTSSADYTEKVTVTDSSGSSGPWTLPVVRSGQTGALNLIAKCGTSQFPLSIPVPPRSGTIEAVSAASDCSTVTFSATAQNCYPLANWSWYGPGVSAVGSFSGDPSGQRSGSFSINWAGVPETEPEANGAGTGDDTVPTAPPDRLISSFTDRRFVRCCGSTFAADSIGGTVIGKLVDDAYELASELLGLGKRGVKWGPTDEQSDLTLGFPNAAWRVVSPMTTDAEDAANQQANMSFSLAKYTVTGTGEARAILMRTGLTTNYQNVLQIVVQAPTILEIKHRTSDVILSFSTAASIDKHVTAWSVEGASTQVLANVNAAPSLTVLGAAWLGGHINSTVIRRSTAIGAQDETFIRYTEAVGQDSQPYRKSRPAQWVF